MAQRLAGRALATTTGLALVLAVLSSVPSLAQSVGANWPTYEGDNSALHYSSLSQINRQNITQLQVAWTYELKTTSLTNPLVVDGVMYIIGDGPALVALDAASGKVLWSRPGIQPGKVRGLAYWQSKDGSDRRILYTNNQALSEVDARTGKDITTIGVGGKVDLREGLGRTLDQVPRITSSTPGRVFENLYIIGSVTGEAYGSPPGDIRAYDILTGKLAWTFHTIPRPGEKGYEQWPKDLWKTAGGVNNWGGMAVDDKRAIAYVPLGSATYDFWGVDRPGSNLYANSLVALDARTGKLLWHFQTVHHDLWDYDLTTSPVLLTVKHNGKNVDVVAQPGKTGFLYVFDRVTGKPLWPIVERPVPKSNVPGEKAWPTQPFPTVVPPFARQKITADDIDPRLEKSEYDALRARVAAARNEGIFTPAEIDRETVQMPGNHGGANWGLSGAEPGNTGRVYVASYDLPAILKLEMTAGQPRTVGMSPLAAGEALYKANCQLCHGADRQGAAGIPELKAVGARLKPTEVKQVITEGRATMPAFGAMISASNIDNVVAYLTGIAPVQQQFGRPAANANPEDADGQQAPPPAARPGAPVTYEPLRYHSPYGFFYSSKGTPAIKPPWSTLTAYDLTVPKILWQVPIGGYPARGADPTGIAQSKGGIMITAGGLIFSSSNEDWKVHAWDKDTGKLLWEGKLPSEGQGIPSTYSVNGRQYIAVPAAAWTPQQPNAPKLSDLGSGKNSIVVYALPKR